LDRALIHRQDADDTILGTYFTLRVGTLFVSLALLVAVAPVLRHFYPAMPLLGWVLLALAGVEVVKGFSNVQETLLSKDMAFRSLALTDVVASVTMTIVAPLLAWQGWGVWALVAEQASGLLARFAMTWLVFSRWRPRLGWDAGTARWFWDYGRPAWSATNLAFLLDRFDDFWIGTALGKMPLGYYSRAFEFARYPRRVVANPLVSVFGPVFARLQGDRLRLSQAFYRAAHVILRSGCSPFG
jgi:O-antigen/teichoic acid export membrane protein